MAGSVPTQARKPARARALPEPASIATQSELNGWEREVVNAVPDLICVIEDGNILSINASGASMLGYRSTSRLCGRSFNDFLHPESVGAFARMLRSDGADGPLHRIRLKRPRRGVLEVEARAVAVEDQTAARYIIHAQDCADRRQAEDDMRRAYDALEERVAERVRALNTETAERRRAETELLLAGKVIHSLTEAVIIADTDFIVTTVNPAFQQVSGYASRDVIGRKAPFLEALGADRAALTAMRRALRATGHWEGEIWSTRKGGERYAEHLSISAITDENGDIRQHAVVITDVTKRREDEERIRYQANYDALTGLPNRALFFDRLNQSIGAMKRGGKRLALMFIDLDGFKLVNDTLGHEVGDLLLKEASERLVDCVRPGDTVARFGGDEFTVIVPDIDGPSTIPLIAQRLIDALNEPFHLKGHESFVSGSVGITLYPDDGARATDLLRNADAAMYRAKEQGKATFHFYTTDINREVKERLALKNGLNKALERGEFSLHYQPKLEIASGRITGVEALMRWNNDALGMVSPVRFIPVMEESGMVVEVGEWALRTACEQHLAWAKAGFPGLRVAVNLSARQLREPRFVDMVKQVLRDTGVDPSGLKVEITESMLMSDAESAVVALTDLHDLGIHVAMDDFGTGYSSLSYLKRFPIDTIKIDRSFVADITTNSDDAEIIRTIITMGHTLNRRVVAEGVETGEQCDLLAEYRCDEIQGYVFSPPLPADRATRFLKDNRTRFADVSGPR